MYPPFTHGDFVAVVVVASVAVAAANERIQTSEPLLEPHNRLISIRSSIK